MCEQTCCWHLTYYLIGLLSEMACLTSARFNMKADILLPTSGSGEVIDEPNEWILTQDPDSGEIIRGYRAPVDNPATPTEDESALLGTFKCMARGIVDGGIRVAGTTETFTEIYDNVDYVRIWFPASVILTKRHQVTNIRDGKGNIIWREEEIPGAPPTIFNVKGVTPMPTPFGKLGEKVAMLERADRQ